MTALAIELRRACSVLLKTKGFTAAAVLTLALGMTLCTTAMVVVKAYLLSGLPYPAADRLYLDPLRNGGHECSSRLRVARLEFVERRGRTSHRMGSRRVLHAGWGSRGVLPGCVGHARLRRRPRNPAGNWTWLRPRRIRAGGTECCAHQPSSLDRALRARSSDRRPDVRRVRQRSAERGRAIHDHRSAASGLLAYQSVHRRPGSAPRANVSIHGPIASPEFRRPPRPNASRLS